MQRLLLACLAAICLIAIPALADKLPLPKAAYSADVVFTDKGKAITGRIFVDGPLERRELTNAAGRQSITIIRRDKGKVYDIKPLRKLAVAMRIAAAQAAGKTGAPGTDIDSFYGVDAEPQGVETLNGLSANKYGIKIDGGPEFKVDATVWATDDGIIVKVIGKTSIDTDNMPAKMELKNIVRGPQDPALFDIPTGYDVLSAGDGDAPDKTPAPDAASPASAAATPENPQGPPPPAEAPPAPWAQEAAPPQSQPSAPAPATK